MTLRDGLSRTSDYTPREVALSMGAEQRSLRLGPGIAPGLALVDSLVTLSEALVFVC